MIVAIAGAHGKIALRLTRLLSADGDSVIGLIRNPDQATDVSDREGSPVLSDLESASEEQIAAAIKGADAALFAAGAGGGGSAERTLTVDRDGAIKLLRAAAKAGVPRYLIISAGGAEDRRTVTTASASTSAPRQTPTRPCSRAISNGRS